jgi:putative ABC transport system permease protein
MIQNRYEQFSEGEMGRRSPNPLWRKSPFVLTRYPWLLSSLTIGALLLALAVSVYPLFISARTSNLVTAAISNPLVTRAGAGIGYRIENLALHHSRFPSPGVIGGRFKDLMAEEPLYGPTVAGILGPEVSISIPEHRLLSAPGRLFAATGAFRHVRLLEGGGGRGVWISDLTASQLGVKPGARISFSFQGMPPVKVTVGAIYRALYVEPRTAYWHWWDSDIYQRCQVCDPPPPFVLLTPHQFTQISMGMGSPTATLSWQAPVAPGRTLTLDDALALEQFTNRFRAEISDPTSALGDIFPCCHAPLFAGQVTTSLSSSIANVIANAEAKIATLEQPGRLLQIAGIIVAFVVLSAAGAFAAAARKVEQQLLFSQGSGLSVVIATAGVESILPCALGGAAGVGLAFLLVSAVGASPIAGSASHQAIASAALAIAGAALLVGIVSAISFVGGGESRQGLGAQLARLPWELVLIALAGYSLRRLQTGGAFVPESALHVKKLSPYLLAFPVLAVAGFALVGARLFGALLRWVRERSGRFASSLYLAVHRLAGAPRPTFLLVSASVICLGVFLQAQTVVRSLQTTVDAKAKLFVGSDVEGRVLYETPLPRSFPLPLTRVTRRTDAGALGDGASFDLLAVDPSTFARAAYWDTAFSSLSPDKIASALGQMGNAVPILIAGAPDLAPRSLAIDGVTVRVREIGHASAFPGMSSRRPLVVADEATLLSRLEGVPNPLDVPGASTEFWVKGDPRAAERALRGLKYAPYLILTANRVKDIPEIKAVIDTFIVMNALGLVAALLVIAGMLMYLQARQRSQVVSYGLSLRMGMTDAAHRRALVAELGSMLVYSYAVGLLLALGAAVLLVPRLDPLPSIPPNSLFVSPKPLFAVAFVGVVGTSWLGGWITNRRASAADLGEVMRVAD